MRHHNASRREAKIEQEPPAPQPSDLNSYGVRYEQRSAAVLLHLALANPGTAEAWLLARLVMFVQCSACRLRGGASRFGKVMAHMADVELSPGLPARPPWSVRAPFCRAQKVQRRSRNGKSPATQNWRVSHIGFWSIRWTAANQGGLRRHAAVRFIR